MRRGSEQRTGPPEPALRVILRRLREIMAEPGDGQSRLDKIVRQIAGLMVAEVCSIYLKRQDGSLELFATEGLNQSAVHTTRMLRGEGLVGRSAELAIPINEPEAQSHPAFAYRPETGEEVYHSLLAVPILRGGIVLGVIVVQNKTRREYSDDDVEVLETTAMVVAENIVSGAVAGSRGPDLERPQSETIAGTPLSSGIALGHVVLHEPRVIVTELLAEDADEELERLDAAIVRLRENIDAMLLNDSLSQAGAHREVLDAYRMFANDRGWVRRMRDAVREGLSAGAAVERVHNATRARMLRQNDPFWKERLRDLDDLSDRLQRVLAGKVDGAADRLALPEDAILLARNMGPADLLDYDRSRVRALIVEDGSAQSHVAIVAKALGIAAVGQVSGITERVTQGDAVIVDGETGELRLRPPPEIIAAYADKVRFLARRQSKYRELRDTPAATKDGVAIRLLMNAGLPVDMPHLSDCGAEGIGLFRTELQFMIASTFPRMERQVAAYREILEAAGGKPIVFRSLDIGGDKALPYLRQHKEENPAIGWRAIRLALDRPGLFRLQIRSLLRAAERHHLNVMLPMVSEVYEIDTARAVIEEERERLRAAGRAGPLGVSVGAMIEVPSILFDLDAVLSRVDFISVGSNDLLQFLFAADRMNALVAERFDPLSVPSLRALKLIVDKAGGRGIPVTLCGEMAARPLEAMALIGLGFRSISMSPASVGPVKSMILSLDASRITAVMEEHLASKKSGSLREALRDFAEGDSVEI